MREGQVSGTELAADGILARHRRRAWYGLRAGRESLGGETQGLPSLPPQWVCSALVLETLHERPQFQPGHDKSTMPGRQRTAAPGNQEGRIRWLDPHRGEGPRPWDPKP